MARIVQPLGMSDGINQFLYPTDLRPTEMVRCKNLYPVNTDDLFTRPAMSIHTTVGGAVAGFVKALEFLPIGSPGSYALVVDSVDATRIAAYDESNVPLAGANFGVVSQYGPALIVFNKRLYAFGGAGASSIGQVFQAAGTPSGAEFVDFAFATSGNGALRPAVVGVWKNRFVYGNFGVGNESSIIIADPFDPTRIKANALSANGSYFPVNPDDGDRIIGFVEILQTGQANIQSALLVLKEFSAYLLTGDPLLSDDTAPDGSSPPIDTLSVNRMPVNCGGSSPMTVCTTPFGVIWAGPDDVWIFPEGQLPYRVGTKIRPSLKATPAQMRYRWHAAFHDGFYKLALFAAGAGPSADSPCGEQYWLDMRQGPPRSWQEARWFGPMVHQFTGEGSVVNAGTYTLAVDVRANSERGLYGAYGDNGGGAIHTIVTFNAPSDLDCGLYPIEWEILSKSYKTLQEGDKVVADPIQEKGLHGIELPCIPGRKGQLGWQWILNETSAGSEQLVAMVPPGGFIIGESLLSQVALSGEDSLLALDPAPTRAVGRSIQIRLYNKLGYYISSTVTIAFQIEVSPAVFVEVTSVVPAGMYATALALAQAVAAGLTANLTAYGITISAALNTGKIEFSHSAGRTIKFGGIFIGLSYQTATGMIGLLLGFSDFFGVVAYSGSPIQATDAVIASPTPIVLFPDGAAIHFYTVPRRIL